MANSNLKFRLATIDDALQIHTLLTASFRADDTRENWTADTSINSGYTIPLEAITTKITNSDSEVLLATDPSNSKSPTAIVATVGVVKAAPNLARIVNIAVDGTYQQGGVGRRVLAYAEDYCRRTWGVEKLGLNALSPRKELMEWYMRCGYRKTGELTPFGVTHINGAELPDDLCFVEFEKDVDASAAN